MYYRFQTKYFFIPLKYYLMFFSIFATGSILFFETTLGTQLSLIDTLNTFGRSLKYTQPLYLEGYILSFVEMNSYLKIFTTSFLGAIFFKLILLLIDQNSLIVTLENFGLPVGNEDFVNYLREVNDISILKFALVFFLLYSMVMSMRRTLKN